MREVTPMMPGEARMLVLFDIDGTLTTGSSCGRYSFEAALREVIGLDDGLRDISLHGNIDFRIVQDAALRAGCWPEHPEARRELVRAVLARYRAHFEARVRELPYRALPGAHEAVGAAQAACEMVGLATGNIEPCARGKLGSAGLGERFAGCVGGYGDDGERRSDLVRVAIARARERGARANEVLLVGDTPLDIEAGHEAGARVAAVATGRFGAEALRAAGADRTYADLFALVADPPWRT